MLVRKTLAGFHLRQAVRTPHTTYVVRQAQCRLCRARRLGKNTVIKMAATAGERSGVVDAGAGGRHSVIDFDGAGTLRGI